MALKQKLKEYKLDSFSEDAAKVICTGMAVDTKVIADVLDSPKIGNEKYKALVQSRLVEGKESIFLPIKKLKLNTERMENTLILLLVLPHYAGQDRSFQTRLLDGPIKA